MELKGLISRRPGSKFLIDLARCNESMLRQAGVNSIENLEIDTFRNTNSFFHIKLKMANVVVKCQ